MDDLDLQLASYLMGEDWEWWSDPRFQPYQRVCSACGRTTCCAPDCAPFGPQTSR